MRITAQAAQTSVVATPGDEAIAAQGLMKSSSTPAYKEAAGNRLAVSKNTNSKVTVFER